MRFLLLSCLVGAAAAASFAAAQPQSPVSPQPRGDAATICIDPAGIRHPPVCRKMSASRFPAPPDICLCGQYREVKAPWCAPGERAPAESAALDRARLAAAQDGSLFGDNFEGRPMCIELK